MIAKNFQNISLCFCHHFGIPSVSGESPLVVFTQVSYVMISFTKQYAVPSAYSPLEMESPTPSVTYVSSPFEGRGTELIHNSLWYGGCLCNKQLRKHVLCFPFCPVSSLPHFFSSTLLPSVSHLCLSLVFCSPCFSLYSLNTVSF